MPGTAPERPGHGGNSGRFVDDLLTAGATPLLRAAVHYDDEAIRILLDHGARVDIADAAGKTPIDATKGNAGGRDYKKVDEIIALVQNAPTAQNGKPLSASTAGDAAP
jgi:hypothetical protein